MLASVSRILIVGLATVRGREMRTWTAAAGIASAVLIEACSGNGGVDSSGGSGGLAGSGNAASSGSASPGTSGAAGSGTSSGRSTSSGSGTGSASPLDGGAQGASDASSGAMGSKSGGDAQAPRDASASDASAAAGDAGALDALRQACVDKINMDRATLNLTPLARATPTQEACSDKGAQMDATSMMAHSSAGMCPGSQGQDTCPQLPVGSGYTLQSALMQCLDQMWAEGPPPSGTTVQQCIQDYQGCFLKHGHYINMTMARYKGVSCGFYQISSALYWGNQDFY